MQSRRGLLHRYLVATALLGHVFVFVHLFRILPREFTKSEIDIMSPSDHQPVLPLGRQQQQQQTARRTADFSLNTHYTDVPVSAHYNQDNLLLSEAPKGTAQQFVQNNNIASDASEASDETRIRGTPRSPVMIPAPSFPIQSSPYPTHTTKEPPTSDNIKNNKNDNNDNPLEEDENNDIQKPAKDYRRQEREIARITRPDDVKELVDNYYTQQRNKNYSPQPTTKPTTKPPTMSPTPQPEPNTTTIILRDHVLRKDLWDGSPIVIESHKLLFLTTPKVSCTVFKQLFRRMMGYPNWKAHHHGLPHNRTINGLEYLGDLRYRRNLTLVNSMLNDPEWTFAVFVRDPKERMLSAYFDKAKYAWYLQNRCCDKFQLDDTTPGCGNSTSVTSSSSKSGLLMSFGVWLKDLVPHCPDHHWTPQYDQLPDRLWPAVNFIGRFENLYNDTKALLQGLISNSTGKNAWEEFGVTGWGTDVDVNTAANNNNQDYSMFDPRLQSSVTHRTGAGKKLQEMYTPWSEDLVERYYTKDFSYERFGFSSQERLMKIETTTRNISGAIT